MPVWLHSNSGLHLKSFTVQIALTVSAGHHLEMQTSFVLVVSAFSQPSTSGYRTGNGE